MGVAIRKKYKKLSRLRPRTTLLTDFYVFDVETGKRKGDIITWELDKKPKAFIFGVIYGHNYTKIIHNLREFHETLKEPRFKKRKIFAHNAEYDLSVLYENIYKIDPTAIFNGKFISATNGVCIFADSMNIFVGRKVSDIGRMIGMAKLGMSGTREYTTTNWANPKEKARAINGCIRDCEIVYEALLMTFEFAGDIKITQASLSMTYYRRFHQPYDIEHNENTSYFWDSYFGGRCEAFFIGPVQASVYDVNSMYPYAMRECVFPNPKFLKVENDISVKKLKNYLQHYEGLVYCEVVHKPTWIGFLPVKKDGKLLFPVGYLRGCWNFNELRYALECNVIEIKKITKVVYSEPMQSPFKGFVDFLFQERFKTTSKFEIDRIKRFMNSLYGKFAQRIDEESIYIDNVEKQWDLINDYQRKGLFINLQMFNSERLDAFLIIKQTKNIDASYSIPSFSSYITSFARVQLLKKLIACENNVPVYCDTDSIFVLLDNNLISEKQLGGWKKEDKLITEINGLKNYKFEFVKDGELIKITRIKGVPTKAKLIDKNKYEYFNLMKTRESMRRKNYDGRLIRRVKQISGKYTKRIVLPDGNTKPITLYE
jgi:hypothetical protein